MTDTQAAPADPQAAPAATQAAPVATQAAPAATQTDADRALKTKHRAMWASGDYPTLASDLIWELG
ncbi:MAG: hypothetical protein M3Y46_11780, partial [Actinomycetota bacterium]|nr:hypothetical protein [Actinomycetota bacterium]